MSLSGRAIESSLPLDKIEKIMLRADLLVM